MVLFLTLYRLILRKFQLYHKMGDICGQVFIVLFANFCLIFTFVITNMVY